MKLRRTTKVCQFLGHPAYFDGLLLRAV